MMKSITIVATLLASTVLTSIGAAAPLITGGVDQLALLTADSVTGYDFTPTGTDLKLTALGFWDGGLSGFSGPFEVGLWNTSTQTLLASVTITSADPPDTSLTVEGGQWRYESVSPVFLQNGESYTIGSYTPSLVADSLTFSGDISDFTFDANVSITLARRVTIASGGLTFPTNEFPASSFGANPSAQITPIPEPTSLASAVFGLLGLIGFGRRRRHA